MWSRDRKVKRNDIFKNDLDAVSTSSWLRSSCVWPLSMRPEQTARSPCCRCVMTILSKIETLLKNHESFEEAPALHQGSTDPCHSKTNRLHYNNTQCNTLLWLKNSQQLSPGGHFTSNSAALLMATPLVATEMLRSWAGVLADSGGRGGKIGV